MAVSLGFPTAAARLRARANCNMGFVVDKLELGHAFSECFSQSFYRRLYTHHPSSEIGTIGEIVAEVRTGFSLNPTQESEKNSYSYYL
jgi:hypothetical protein